MLSTLTEDAINTSCSGFDHQGLTPYGTTSSNTSGSVTKRDVVVTLDIEDAHNKDWSFAILPGTWKRICMNLVSNALKYTPSGHISVSLRKQWFPSSKNQEGGPRVAQVCFTVQDTGIGMSQAYQDQNLFRPFRQEDSLSQGTGLGLNLVAKLAKGEGGTVNVKSRKGEGTSVSVTVPLRSAPLERDEHVEDPTLSLGGSVVDMIGFAPTVEETNDLTTSSDTDRRISSTIRSTLSQLSINVRSHSMSSQNGVDLQIISEGQVRRDRHTGVPETGEESKASSATLDRPSIVICETRASALHLRSKSPHVSATQFIWHPIGPAKLAAALLACYEPLAENSKDQIYPQTATTAPSNPLRDAPIPDLSKANLVLRLGTGLQEKATSTDPPPGSPPVLVPSSIKAISQGASQLSQQQSPGEILPLLFLVDDNVSFDILDHVGQAMLTLLAACEPSNSDCLREQGRVPIHTSDRWLAGCGSIQTCASAEY
jgi:hypothetical protein